MDLKLVRIISFLLIVIGVVLSADDDKSPTSSDTDDKKPENDRSLKVPIVSGSSISQIQSIEASASWEFNPFNMITNKFCQAACAWYGKSGGYYISNSKFFFDFFSFRGQCLCFCPVPQNIDSAINPCNGGISCNAFCQYNKYVGGYCTADQDQDSYVASSAFTPQVCNCICDAYQDYNPYTLTFTTTPKPACDGCANFTPPPTCVTKPTTERPACIPRPTDTPCVQRPTPCPTRPTPEPARRHGHRNGTNPKAPTLLKGAHFKYSAEANTKFI